ncbi:unnamed protein product [Parnassius apollo]|uniref:(apollo) hypothetical protein n=1 Tax=Parnassius apollo TaxID=110799 RepID=A0A8S3XEU9_PARAO|nr:unnamed protein product [Parnassius apollo]
MDLLQSDDEEQEILQILAENGIKITNSKKKHQSRIQILENILVYKPDNELLHAINIAAESDPSFKCPKESPLEVDVQASNLDSLLSVATENGPEIEFEDTFSVTGIDEGAPKSNAIIKVCEASEGVSELEITHFATNDSQTIGVVELNDSTEPIIDTETLVVESGLETIDTEEPENKPKRRKHAACTEWQRNITKEKRMRGELFRIFQKGKTGYDSITKPKKDRCDVCCGYETKNVTEEVYKKHIEKKKAARLEKEADKKLAIDGKITVLTVDLQKEKVCPKVQASAVYYKTKLCCHNFTVYNLATHEVTCYWWHECEGELQASNFASCLVDYIQEKVPKTIPLVIFSDGCTAQN